jgi:hypothetical protein
MMWERYRPKEAAMSLNGIMGIGISSSGVPDERKEVVRGEREVHKPALEMKPDNLSAVQADYVTLQTGAGQGGLIGVLTPTSSQSETRGGEGFHAIA